MYKLTGLLDVTGVWSSTNGAEHYELLLKLLFSVNCQATVAYRAIRSFHFHHLWVHHTGNYIIPPHMWVRHIPVGPPLS